MDTGNRTLPMADLQKNILVSGNKAMQMLELSRHSFEKVVKDGLLTIIYENGKKYYYTYPTETRKALIRLGVYSMLSRAGYDTSPVQDTIEQDEAVCANILQDKELLFSPYQTLHHSVVDEALGIKRTATGSRTQATMVHDGMQSSSVMGKHLILLN